jgi:hypothetical protein
MHGKKVCSVKSGTAYNVSFGKPVRFTELYDWNYHVQDSKRM